MYISAEISSKYVNAMMFLLRAGFYSQDCMPASKDKPVLAIEHYNISSFWIDSFVTPFSRQTRAKQVLLGLLLRFGRGTSKPPIVKPNQDWETPQEACLAQSCLCLRHNAIWRSHSLGQLPRRSLLCFPVKPSCQ